MKDRQDAPARRQLNAITRAFAALLVFSVLVVAGLVAFSLQVQDRVVMRESVHLVGSMLGDARERLSEKLLDYSYWNEAVRHLVHLRDAAWADAYVGEYLWMQYGIDNTFVLDPNNDVTYAAVNGRRTPPSDLEPFNRNFLTLVERGRSSVKTLPPKPATGFAEIGGMIYMIGASELTNYPNENAPGVSRGSDWLLVFGKALDKAELAKFEQKYRLRGLRVVEAVNDNDVAALNLPAADGKPLGALTWDPSAPYRDVLPWLSTVVVLILIAFGFIALVFFRRSHEIMSVLSDNMSELRMAHQTRNDALIEAREANEAKTKFLTSMSHELRTPLNAIMGLADMQRHKVFGPVGNPRYEEYAEDIHASADHLLKLINDVLDISAIEAGKMNVEMNFIPIASVVDKCVPMIRQVAEKKGIRFSLDVEDGLPEFYGHDRSITQILINLLNNAVKYTPAGGEIGLAIRWENGGHVIVVKDTGMGIAPHKLPMITDPYTRFHEDESAKIEGTGLGLSITKELVQIHGGRIDIDSVVGRGTVVTITFRGVTSGQISLFDEKDV